MPRYTEAELNELKQAIDLVALIQSRGIALTKHGSKDLKGLCPFHNDTNPSLIVSPHKNLWNCPACGKGGDCIRFVQEYDGVSFRHAVELLKNGHVVDSSDRVKKATIPKLPAPVELDIDDHKQLIRVIDYYHERLLQTTPARDYLEKRGIFSAEAAKTFKLGYADRTLGLRLPHKNRKNGKVIREQLEKIGVYRETGREHLNGCLVIPVIDENGLITEVYGRKLSDKNANKGILSHLYLPGPHKGIWNPTCLAGKEVILCESLIDALTFWVHGFRNVTASYGTDGFTPDHLAAFIDRRIETIFIAYDRDDAGDAGAAKVAERLTDEGIRCRRVQFPRGMDTNTYALNVKPADRSLRLLLESAPWIEGQRPVTSNQRPGKTQSPTTRGLQTELVVEDQLLTDINDHEQKELQRPDSLAESDGNGTGSLSSTQTLSEGRKPCSVGSDKESIGLGTGEHCGGARPSASEGVLPVSGNGPGQSLGTRDTADTCAQPGVHPPERVAEAGNNDSGNRQSHQRPDENAKLKETGRWSLAAGNCRFNGDDIEISLGERRYRVRGLARNNSYDILKVNLRVGKDDFFHFDTLDLYNARHRKAFIHAASDELKVEPDTIKRDVGRVLLKLEELQEQNLTEALEVDKPEVVELDDIEKSEALELLRSPQLLDRIAADFEACGLVGERANALVAYLAAVSRLTDDPLAVIIQSSSSAGKSSLLDAVLSFMPEEDQVKYTAMTGQSLFYMGETELQHKILAISEEEGAEQAGYALKILQSEKHLRIASTGKDPKTGRLITQEYHVNGPSAMFFTTTAAEVDEELQNRCLVLTVNEERRQTEHIHTLQRNSRTLDGMLCGQEKKRLQSLHCNAQRLLKPLLVVNPYAKQLTFCSHSLRTRRDHVKYLNLINAIALLHQYQRPIRTVMHNSKRLSYIEVTLDDINSANALAGEVMGVSLDELPPQTRKLLHALETIAKARCKAEEIELRDLRLSRREIREATGWSDTQLRVHLGRLVDMEYLLVHAAGRGGRCLYEVLYRGEGNNGERFLMNLTDIEKLRQLHDYDAKVAGKKEKVAPRLRVDSGPVAPRSQSKNSVETTSEQNNNDTKPINPPEDHVTGLSKNESSYIQERRSDVSGQNDESSEKAS